MFLELDILKVKYVVQTMWWGQGSAKGLIRGGLVGFFLSSWLCVRLSVYLSIYIYCKPGTTEIRAREYYWSASGMVRGVCYPANRWVVSDILLWALHFPYLGSKIIIRMRMGVCKEHKVWNNCSGEWERMNQEGIVWPSGTVKDPLEVHGHVFKMRSDRRVLSFSPAMISCKKCRNSISKNMETEETDLNRVH